MLCWLAVGRVGSSLVTVGTGKSSRGEATWREGKGGGKGGGEKGGIVSRIGSVGYGAARQVEKGRLGGSCHLVRHGLTRQG